MVVDFRKYVTFLSLLFVAECKITTWRTCENFHLAFSLKSMDHWSYKYEILCEDNVYAITARVSK